MHWLIWFILWILISLPIGIILLRIFKKDTGYIEYEIFIIKSIVIILLGLFFIATTLNSALMLWQLGIFFFISLTVDLILLDNKWALASSLLLILSILIIVFVSFCAGNNNAIYFNDFIEEADGFPIQNEIPDNMLRLTTKELAESIASQHMGEFGSAVVITSSSVAMIEERLYWLVMIAKKENWGQKYNTAGIIAVDANDPDRPVKIIKFEFDVAQDLDFNVILGARGNAQCHGYFGIDTASVYNEAYPIINPETKKWNLILTSYTPDLNLVRHYNGVYQLDQNGKILNHYDSTEIPEWIIKPFNEDDFLETGINDWGAHRRDDGFDLFAGGFFWIPPSNDRLKKTEDTRFIYNPDNNQIVSMTLVNPIRKRGELSLAGVFKATSKGIQYYDLKDYDLMSGIAASGIVKSKITSRSGSEYYTAMELLYPMKVENQTKYVWFVPIYYKTESSGMIGLAGLGIVDAQSADKVVIEYTGKGVSGETLIKKAKESFYSLYTESSSITTNPPLESMEVTIISKYDFYVKEGNTRGWLKINTPVGEKEVLVTSESLTDSEMLEIQKSQKGDSLKITLEGFLIKKIF